MKRWQGWQISGLAVATLVAGCGLLAFSGVHAAPEPRPITAAPPAQAAAKSFSPACKAAEITDSRPDPAWVGASFEHDNCWAPRPPAPLNGYTATRPQIVASMAAAKRYQAAADDYQKCITDFVAARNAHSENDAKAVKMAFSVIENHRITASRENQKKVTRQVEAAINAFNEYGSECTQ